MNPLAIAIDCLLRPMLDLSGTILLAVLLGRIILACAKERPSEARERKRRDANISGLTKRHIARKI